MSPPTKSIFDIVNTDDDRKGHCYTPSDYTSGEATMQPRKVITMNKADMTLTERIRYRRHLTDKMNEALKAARGKPHGSPEDIAFYEALNAVILFAV